MQENPTNRFSPSSDSRLLEQAIIRVMFIDICKMCITFVDDEDTKNFHKNIYTIYTDFNFTDEIIRKASNKWKRRRQDLAYNKSSMILLILYHFTVLAELDIDEDSNLSKMFSELSQHIPESYFPTNERQTDSVVWLETKGKARKLLLNFQKNQEVF